MQINKLISWRKLSRDLRRLTSMETRLRRSDRLLLSLLPWERLSFNKIWLLGNNSLRLWFKRFKMKLMPLELFTQLMDSPLSEMFITLGLIWIKKCPMESKCKPVMKMRVEILMICTHNSPLQLMSNLKRSLMLMRKMRKSSLNSLLTKRKFSLG